jgi:hypothetical protein
MLPQLLKNEKWNETTNSVELLILSRLTMELSELRQDVQISRCCMLVSRSGKETKSPLGKDPLFYIKCVSLWFAPFAYQLDIRVQLAADREK